MQNLRGKTPINTEVIPISLKHVKDFQPVITGSATEEKQNWKMSDENNTFLLTVNTFLETDLTVKCEKIRNEPLDLSRSAQTLSFQSILTVNWPHFQIPQTLLRVIIMREVSPLS